MPLSEHEQRVLRQIERQFQADPGLVGTLDPAPEPRDDARSAKRSAAGFTLGLLALLVSFASSWVIGVLGFVAMLVCAVRFVRAVNRLVAVRIAQLGPRAVSAVSAPGRRIVGPITPGGDGRPLFWHLRDALWGPVPSPGPGERWVDEGDDDELGTDGPGQAWED